MSTREVPGIEPRDRTEAYQASIYLYVLIGILVFAAGLFFLGLRLAALECLPFAALFVLCDRLTRAGARTPALFLGFLSITALAGLGDWNFGWSYGAHCFVITALPLVLVTERIRKGAKLAWSALVLGVFVLLWALLHGRPALYTFPSPWGGFMGDVNLLISFGVLAFSFQRYSQAFLQSERRLKEASGLILQIANTDALTGIANRRFVTQVLEEDLVAVADLGRLEVVGLADIDNFKAVNDGHGHACGDAVLKEVARRLQASLRKGDLLGRWGGEEFLIVLRDSDLEKGRETLERLRHAIADSPFAWGEQRLSLGITIGASLCRPGVALKDIVAEADRLLYQGKHSGKNRVVS